MERNQSFKAILFGIFLGFILTPAYAIEKAHESPVGYWKTIDDVTGNAKSIVQIWKRRKPSP